MKFDSRFFRCVCCAVVLAVGSVGQVYADLPEALEDGERVDIIVEEIPGDPADLLEDVPMPMSLDTPIEEFSRLPSVWMWSQALGGYRYGNSIRGDIVASVQYRANVTPLLPLPETSEYILEMTFVDPVDQNKIYITSKNVTTGFSFGFTNGTSYTKLTCTSFRYVDEHTVRVSYYCTAQESPFVGVSIDANCAHGVAINVYCRETAIFSEGGDGGGGSQGGGGAAT